MVSLGLPPVAPITLILLGAAVGLVSTSGPVITAASVAPPLQTTGHHVSDATATVPCTFNESLHGLECFGLSLHGAASSAAECSAACCALGAKCSSWQFCGDFTTYCGAEHGGCYIGDISHEGCHWQSGCEAEACWDGGCRGGTCPTIGPAPPPAPPPPAQCGSAGLPPCLVDLEEVGLQFDGVGGITSNGECRLLYDYGEPARSELLDYLFLPNFGLSTQILKVEIGSDAQSTVGTEPSYQHVEGDISYDRGIQFWFMVEAKKRNPDIVIAALAWSAPSWVGGNASSGLGECGSSPEACPFFTDKNIEYILNWMHGATAVWNVTIDYVGVWNEPPIEYIPPGWLVKFRAALDGHGYTATQLVAPDASSTGSQVDRLVSDMLDTADVGNAVDVIGTHGFWSARPSSFKELIAKFPKNAKRAWVSESWHGMGTWGGAMSMVDGILTSQQLGYSGWTAWGLLFAAYPVTLCQDKGLLYSTQPWAGSYNIQPSVWTTAHITQFSKPGWSWLEMGNGTGSFGSGGIYATLVNPKTKDWSLIISNFGEGSSSTTLTFAVRHAASGPSPRLVVFSTNATDWFVQLTGPAVRADGTFTVDVAAGTVYTVSTLTTARKGSHPHSELAAPFPLPHSDNFSSYTDGRSPRYFTDWDGSFSIENHVLRQLVVQPPIKWHCTDVDPITLVGPGYANYEVATTARVDSGSGYVAVYARVQKPFSGWCPTASGYSLKVFATGNWTLLAAATPLAHGTIPAGGYGAWRALRLRVNGTSIEASVNGTVLVQVQDGRFDNGPAAVGSGYHLASFSAFAMDGAPTRMATSPPHGSVAAGYPVFTGTALSATTTAGQYGLAFTPLVSLTVAAVSRFAVANSSGKHTLSIYCAVVNATQIDARCVSAGSGLLAASVVSMQQGADATGLVWAPISASGGDAVVLVPTQQYVLVSSETSGGDPFYTTTTSYSCMGSTGPGGTLPKLDVQVASVRIDGGAHRDGSDGPFTLLWDYRPRSFGPLSFAVAATELM